MNGWEQGGGQTGEDHMGCWQCSWWEMGYGAGMRGGEEGEVRFSEWGGRAGVTYSVTWTV